MPCYPCTHCNKCGLFSMKLDLRCNHCGNPIVAGLRSCPECGSSYQHNMKRGKIVKPVGSSDYYTEIIEAQRHTNS